MLLVKSKELKSLSKLHRLKRGMTLFASLFFLSCPLFAEEKSAQSIGSASTLLSVFMSLILVIGIVFMLAYLMRRFNVTQSGSQELQVVASMVVGTRERMMVIQVGQEQHLIGITANRINHLAKLEQPISGNAATENLKSKFQNLLLKQQSTTKGE